MKPNAETIEAMVEAEIARQQRSERKQEEWQANSCPVVPSSKQRLAELLAEFEAARDAYLDDGINWFSDDENEVVRNRHLFPELAGWSVDHWADGHGRDGTRMKDGVEQAARRYIIARDNGIFDDSWEVMWKLRFGGAV